MTAQLDSRPTGRSAVDAPAPLPVRGILASEATKLRSVRSTWWTVAATVAIMVGLGALFCFAYVSRFDHLDPKEKLFFDPTQHALQGIYLAQLAMGVLGVLAITNEYATGMIRNTFLAVPQRSAVLAAKVAVFATGAAIVAFPTALVTFLLGQSILSHKHVQASLSDPGVLRAVIGAGGYLVGIGLLGLALGALLRSTAASIATLVSLVLILPILAEALPTPWNNDVSKFLPGNAGLAVIATRADPGSLSPMVGGVVFVGYVVVTLIAAFVLLDRRDA